MFYSLVIRLPAYSGVIAARLANEADRGPGPANDAVAARSDAPATAASLSGLNAQLGGEWFSHAAVPGD